MTAPPFNTHLDKMFAWVLDAVVMSPPAIAMPFDVFHPAGLPSVVMMAHGLLDSAIGYVIVDSPFVLKNNPHCLYGQQYPCYRAFPRAGISLLRFIIWCNHNRICCALRPVWASHKSGKISRSHGHHSSHSIRDVYRQSEALSHSI